MTPFHRRFVSSILLGLLVGLPTSPANPLGHVQDAHAYSYCSANEYRDNYTASISQGSNSEQVPNQLHYRVNGDCTWKAYNEIYNTGGGGGGIPFYMNGSDLYQGETGQANFFDSAYITCSQGGGTGSYSQVSASSALIADVSFYYQGNCNVGPVTYTYFPNNQP